MAIELMPGYGISLVFDVPIRYAYRWCTDFRNDDPLISGGAYPRNILRRRGNNLVWTQRYKYEGVEKEGVRIVTLRPPYSWHLEAINEEKESTFDYRLAPLGKGRTRLRISVKISYRTIEPESMPELARKLSGEWDKFKTALEKDHSSGRAATA